jgi:hypothetical protein
MTFPNLLLVIFTIGVRTNSNLREDYYQKNSPNIDSRNYVIQFRIIKLSYQPEFDIFLFR